MSLSVEFANELRLQHCINSFIDNRQDMPEYGQLGCAGFIVLDSDHKVLSKATTPFTENQRRAFMHVETLLEPFRRGGSATDQQRGQKRATEQQAGTQLTQDFVESKLKVVSVNVPSMDAEHASCANALWKLATEQSRAALEDAFKEMAAHFAHEEALLEEHGFAANQDEKFSAKKTHINEHRRILDIIQKQLQQSSCRTAVPSVFITDILAEFHSHTSRYDMQYSEFLSSKTVQ
jgi:hemerythrin